jgi:hypothetical protein
MSTRNILGILGDKGRPAPRAENLAAIFESIVYKMWEPQHLKTLWASTACYRDSFTFTYLPRSELRNDVAEFSRIIWNTVSSTRNSDESVRFDIGAYGRHGCSWRNISRISSWLYRNMLQIISCRCRVRVARSVDRRATAEELKLDSRQVQEFFLFSTLSRPAKGPTQPPVKWVTEAHSMRGKAVGAWC